VQSLFLVQFRLQIPGVPPTHVSEMPQSTFAAQALGMHSRVSQVRVPHAVLLAHLHLPLKHVPLAPQSAFVVHVLPPHAPRAAPVHVSTVPQPVPDGVHVEAPQAPGCVGLQVPAPQSVVAPQVHLPVTHRPLPHWESSVHTFARHAPWTAPVQVSVAPQVAVTQELAAQSPTVTHEPPHAALPVH